jgi:hypothetical protein
MPLLSQFNLLKEAKLNPYATFSFLKRQVANGATMNRSNRIRLFKGIKQHSSIHHKNEKPEFKHSDPLKL